MFRNFCTKNGANKLTKKRLLAFIVAAVIALGVLTAGAAPYSVKTIPVQGHNFAFDFINDAGEYCFECADFCGAWLIVGLDAKTERISQVLSRLTITLYEVMSGGEGDFYREDFLIAGVSADEYEVGPYAVFVDSRGDAGIYEFYLIVDEKEPQPECEHIYAPAFTQAPTCENDGYTRYVCPLCGDYYDADIIPAFGHDFFFLREGGGGEYWFECDNFCGTWLLVSVYVNIEEISDDYNLLSFKLIDTLPGGAGEFYFADFKVAKAAAAEYEVGPYVVYVDSNESEVNEYYLVIEGAPELPPVCEHDYELVADLQPTCTEDGYNIFVCALCGAEYEAVVPATGHDFIFKYIDDEGEYYHDCGNHCGLWMNVYIRAGVAENAEGQYVLTVTLYEVMPGGAGDFYREDFLVGGDSSGEYGLGGYGVYVSTDGDAVTECYLII